MSDLRTALLKAGVLSKRQAEESKAEEQLRQEAVAQEALRPRKEQDRRMTILGKTNSPDTFRQEARKLLLANPLLLREIIDLAHARQMSKRHKQGGGRLIRDLLQLRTALNSATNEEERQSVVGKILSKH